VTTSNVRRVVPAALVAIGVVLLVGVLAVTSLLSSLLRPSSQVVIPPRRSWT